MRGRLTSARTRTKRTASGDKRVIKVRIAERCVFYVGEVAYVAGQLVELPKAEAEALLESGEAEHPDEAERRRKEAEAAALVPHEEDELFP